jgi:hypothetical protein
MRYFVFLFPLAVWAILPQSEINKIAKKHHDDNTSFVYNYSYKQSKYLIIVNAEEQFSPDDVLEEEIPYLKAGIKNTLFKYMKKKYPKLISIEVSKMLYGPFWRSKSFFHSIAQARVEDVNPVYKSKNIQTIDNAHHSDKNISIQNNNLAQFSMNSNANHKILLESISVLKEKSKKYPSNIKILNKLKMLYKQVGDTEGYSKINDQIIDARMSL